MHDNFADWYRYVSIEPQSDVLQKRWAAIDEHRENWTVHDLLEIVRIFYQIPTQTPEFMQKLRAPFKTADTVFSMSGNDAELRVLAGAILADHVGLESEWSTFTSLAIVSAGFNNARTGALPEVIQLAQDALEKQSSRLRDVKSTPSLPPPLPRKELKALEDAASTPEEFKNAVLAVLTPLHEHLSAINKWALLTDRTKELRAEESDILWYLFGEHSRDLKSHFSEVKENSLCFIVAKELADLTRLLPGPFSLEAFLDTLLSFGKDPERSITLSEIVSACSTEWQTQLLTADNAARFLDLCPVHLAIQKAIEADGNKTRWNKSFLDSSGIRATVKHPQILISVQLYRERLLCRAFHILEPSE